MYIASGAPMVPVMERMHGLARDSSEAPPFDPGGVFVAQKFKEVGNALVARKLWSEAFHSYADGTSALCREGAQRDPCLGAATKGMAIALFCNVALCALKLGRHEDTVDAATECLTLDEK